MTGSRSAIFAEIGRALGRGADTAQDAAAAATAAARLAGAAGRNVVPLRGQRPYAERRDLFVAMARELAATVDVVANDAAVPEAVAAYLARENLPAALRAAPDAALRALPWQNRPMLAISEGPARPADLVSLTGAFAGIAETGTLMLLSGPISPTTLNFLPDTHIAVLWGRGIVPALEDAFDMLRQAHGRGEAPRTVNFISGPSRSADIEQVLQMGAHGPRRLHIVIVDDGRD